MFGKKTETIKFDSFMKGTWKEEAKLERQTKLASYAAVGSYLVTPSISHAANAGDIMMNAFDPIIVLLQGASYPVAFIMITGGFLLIMMGQKHRGLSFIKWAAIGYVGMQFAPAIMGILHEIGVQMKGAR
jgi:hypothetical protein